MHRTHSLRFVAAFAFVALFEASVSRASDEPPAPRESSPEGAFTEASPSGLAQPGAGGEPSAADAPPSEAAAAAAAPTTTPPADAAFPAEAAPTRDTSTTLLAPVPAERAEETSWSANSAGASRPDSAAVPARTIEPSAEESEYERRHPSDGLFGPIRLGFLVGVGLPNLLNFGGTAKITRFFGGGINVGIIPAVRLSYYGEATLSYQEYDIYGRIYPFGGGFFIGAGAGYSKVRGTLRGKVDLAKYTSGQLPIPPGLLPPGYQLPASIDYEARGSVRTMVLTPQLGYLHTFGSGFSIGIDVGAQIPIAPSDIVFESSVSPSQVAELEPFKEQQKKVRDTLETVGRTPLPSLNFRIGWLL